MQDLVRRAQEGDHDAFTSLIRRYQNMALVCALSRVGDFQLAEDVVQEASLSAYHNVGALVDRAAFGAWFRSIVLHHSHRVLRRRNSVYVSMEDAGALVSPDPGPLSRVQRDFDAGVVMDAVHALPDEQREVVLLYYMDDIPHREIARLLNIPVATVNNRLHAARAKLKRRTVAMLKENLSERKLGDDFTARIGEIVKVRGPIIDVRLAADDSAGVLDSLKIVNGDTATTFAVAQRLGGGLVRCVPVRPKGTEAVELPAISNGAAIVRAEADVIDEVTEAELARIVDIFTAPRVRGGIVETGVKVIDFFCPLTVGGSVGLFGLAGVGKGVMLGELTRRLSDNVDGLTIFGLGKRTERALGQESIRNDTEFFGLVDKAAAIEVVHLVTDLASNPDFAGTNDTFDASLYFSVELAVRWIWPAIDPLISRSKALTPEIAGAEHCAVVDRAREVLTRAADLMVDPVFLKYLAHGAGKLAANRAQEWETTRLAELSVDDRTTVVRARKLELFMGQPLKVAEPWTKRPGIHVPLVDTLAAVVDILDGRYDGVDVEAFRFKSGIDEVTA